MRLNTQNLKKNDFLSSRLSEFWARKPNILRPKPETQSLMKLEARNFGPVPALFCSARQLLSANPLLATIFETQENFLSVHIFIFHFLFLGTIFLPQQLQQKIFYISSSTIIRKQKEYRWRQRWWNVFHFSIHFFYPGFNIFVSVSPPGRSIDGK